MYKINGWHKVLLAVLAAVIAVLAVALAHCITSNSPATSGVLLRFAANPSVIAKHQ